MIFISGASRGIGLGFVMAYLKLGKRVIAGCRVPEAAKDLQALKKKFPDLLNLAAIDLASASLEEQCTAATHGASLSLLINCAGILPESDLGGFARTSFQDWEEAFRINVVGSARVAKALLPALKKAAQLPGGAKVAQITSLMGSISDNSSGGYYAYRISKAALNMFNKSFAIDHPGITSLVLHPGWVKTDMGGAGASLTVEQSVSGLIAVIEKAKPSDTGKFFDHEGDELEW